MIRLKLEEDENCHHYCDEDDKETAQRIRIDVGAFNTHSSLFSEE
jgi:hypothetical protein